VSPLGMTVLSLVMPCFSTPVKILFTAMSETDQKIVTRKEAQALGLTQYFTGGSCVQGHVSARSVSNKSCVECARIRSLERRALHPEKVRAEALKHYHANAEKCREASRESYRKNPEKRAEYQRQYIARNRERSREQAARDRAKNKEARNETTRAWRKRNLDKQNFYSAKRYAMKMSAVPTVREDLVPFLRAETLAVYAEARTTSELTGIRHDVDHIFPLSKGGAHAPWNLRVLLGSENQSKKDKWPKGEPTHVMWHGELVSRLIG